MNEADRLKARLRPEETLSNPRIVVHSGKLELGQYRGAVFDLSSGTLIIGSKSTIHIIVIEDAGLPVETGRYLSGYARVTNDGIIEWETTGAMSTFPPGHLPLPLSTVLDKIRGTGARVVS